MAMQEEIPGILYRSGRPGWPEKSVSNSKVVEWCEAAKSLGVKTILCLLDPKQLAYYPHTSGGLLSLFTAEKLKVVHHSVPDHLNPPVPKTILDSIDANDLLRNAPTLVHCSAGQDRTGRVIAHILRHEVFRPFVRIRAVMEEFSSGRGKNHFIKVTRNSSRIFDLLESEHKLDWRYRVVLWAAAMLHDIGADPSLTSSSKSHGWISADHILKENISCGPATPEAIATVASLHRREGKGVPSSLGEVYAPISNLCGGSLPQELVTLAAILRVADGLDRYQPVEITSFNFMKKNIQVSGTGSGFADSIQQAQKKSALLTEMLGVTVQAEADQAQPPITETSPQKTTHNQPRVATEARDKPLAIFDLRGTLVDYHTLNASPDMRAVVGRMSATFNWCIATSYRSARAREICDRSGYEPNELFHGPDREALVLKALECFAPPKAFYFDDKPRGVAGVFRLQRPELQGRVFGFVGGGVHAAQLQQTCNELRLECLQHPFDIARVLGIGG